MIVIIRKIHFTICRIFYRNLTKNVSNYKSIFDVLRIKFWFSLWKIYSHAKYTFFDYIANITCFKNFVFWFFRNISCFFFEFNVIFSFFFFYSLLFTRFFVCFFFIFLFVSWFRHDFFLFDFFVVLILWLKN